MATATINPPWRTDPLQVIVNLSWGGTRYAIISGFPTMVAGKPYTVLWLQSVKNSDGTSTLSVKYNVLAFTDQGANNVLNLQTEPILTDTLDGNTVNGPYTTQYRAVLDARMDYYGTTTAVPDVMWFNEAFTWTSADFTGVPGFTDAQIQFINSVFATLTAGGTFSGFDGVNPTGFTDSYINEFNIIYGRAPLFPDDAVPPLPPGVPDNPAYDAFDATAFANAQASYQAALDEATIQPVAPYTFWDRKAVQRSSYTPPAPVVGKTVYSDATIKVLATQSAVTVHQMLQGVDTVTQTIVNPDSDVANSIMGVTFVDGFFYIAIGNLVFPRVASIFKYALTSDSQLVAAGEVDPAMYAGTFFGQFAYDTDSDLSMYVLAAKNGFGHFTSHNTFTLTKVTRAGVQIYSVDVTSSLYQGPSSLDSSGPTVGHLGKIVWVGDFLVTQRIAIQNDQLDGDLLVGYDSYIVWFNAKDGTFAGSMLWGSTLLLPEEDTDPPVYEMISNITATDKLPADPVILPDS